MVKLRTGNQIFQHSTIPMPNKNYSTNDINKMIILPVWLRNMDSSIRDFIYSIPNLKI